jgi:hypothetical protein
MSKPVPVNNRRVSRNLTSRTASVDVVATPQMTAGRQDCPGCKPSRWRPVSRYASVAPLNAQASADFVAVVGVLAEGPVVLTVLQLTGRSPLWERAGPNPRADDAT